ncbi:MAG: hypothetical protein R3194_01335 [Limnobacter sp.]|nr:hypothetical protein [Limnobacter sp.]
MITGEMTLLFTAPHSASLKESVKIFDNYRSTMSQIELNKLIAQFTEEAIRFSRFWTDCTDISVWTKTELLDY